MAHFDAAIRIEDYDGETSIVHINAQDMDDPGVNFGGISQDMDEVKDGIATLITGIIRTVKDTIGYPEIERSSNRRSSCKRKQVACHLPRRHTLSGGC